MTTAVMIGVDPHKDSHTAVALGADERQLSRLRVRASAGQAQQLVAWAAAWPERTWAVEGASGLGHLLAQQLVAAGERVLDVQPKLAARVRLLAAGDTNKNDPNDARSVAVAALRSADCRQVRPDDHTAVLCELVPGGVRKEITAAHAARILEEAEPSGAVALARWELAGDFLEDLRRVDAQLGQVKKKLAAAVKASGTTLTEVLGVGPVIAGIVLGEVEDVSRFRDRDHFAACNGTAPVEVSSGKRKVHRLSRRGNRRVNHAVHMAAITQIRHPHSQGRAYYDKKLAEGKTPKEALRALKRRVSDAIYRRLRADARRAASTQVMGPGAQAGNDTDASAAGSHPEHQLFGEATPGPTSTLRPAHAARPKKPSSQASKRNPEPLDTKRLRSGSRPGLRRAVVTPPSTGRSV